MSLNSSSASKRLRTGSSFKDEKASSADVDIVGSVAAESNKATTEETANAVFNVFTDDILPEIFDNLEILCVEDLINYRRVNRSWRDSATSVLLKRNLFKIALSFAEVAFHEDHEDISPSYRYFNPYQPTSFLSDLSTLISTSPKFPCSSIHFHSNHKSGFDCLPSSDISDQNENQNDLFHFFSLHGQKIRKLSLSGEFSREALQNLLFVHMPHLTCLQLDLQNVFGSQSQETSQMQVSCLPRPPTLQINEIVLGTGFHVWENQMDFVKYLLSVSPNLSSIRNADVNSLLLLLEMGKCQLIKDLSFYPATCDIKQILNLTHSIECKCNLSSLKLSKLTIDFQGTSVGIYYFALRFLKTVLYSSMDSLKCLELVFKPSFLHVNNFLLPLPNLKSLKLVDLESSDSPSKLSLGDIIGRASLPMHFSANSITPAIYFPRLREVELEMGDQRKSSDKLMELFLLEHRGSDGVTTISVDTFPTVTYLEVTRFHLYQRNMSKLLPYVSHLKIQCLLWSSLPNWIWTAFPKLERFEVSIQSLGIETNMVDSFFTGISPELCAALESARASTAIKSGLVRSQPYIGDCKNLKEFKFNFERILLCSKFASEVTAVHGFKDVIHRTKIIFSFESINSSVKEMEETRQLLEPVAAYVEIRMKK